MIPRLARMRVFVLPIAFFLMGSPRAYALEPASPTVKCDQTSGVSVYPKCDDQLVAGAQSTRAALPGFGLSVFYVVPADVEFNADVLATLKQSSRNMQAWYEVATGDRTWEFSSPDIVQVYRARENRQYYVDNGNWWGSILTEMGQAGLPIWSPGTITAIWAHGAGFWAGGAPGCEGTCGTVLLGVELFPQFNNPAYSGGECPDPDGEGVEAFPCNPVGAYTHELGHTVGLIHPFDDPALRDVAGHSIMATHWNFPNHAPPSEQPWGFLTAERQTIHDNPFLGERTGVPQIYENLDVAVNLPSSGELPNPAFDVQLDGNIVKVVARDTTSHDYLWTFGDSTSAHGASAEHEYAAPGTYMVRLRVSSDQSMMAVAENTIEVGPSVPPCGKITRNTRLKHDCLAPLKVGANRITVNLNGHSIISKSGQPGVEIIGRRGVTVKNGSINGGSVGLLVKGGGSHTFRNLFVYAEDDRSSSVQIEDVDKTMVRKLICVAPRSEALPFKFTGKKSTISEVSCQADSNDGAFISGERLTILDSDFRTGGDKGGRGLYFSGTRSVIRGSFFQNNFIRPTRPALFVSGNDNIVRQNRISGILLGFELESGSRRNVIRHNKVTVDDRVPDALAIDGGNTACANTWKHNSFTTDSEGDGPNAGCIR